MKILCTGGWGYGNLGDEFILRGTIAAIRDVLPGARVTVSSFSPDQTYLWHRVDTIPSLHLHFTSIRKGIRIARLASAWVSLVVDCIRHTWFLKEAKRIMSNYDLVIQAGGGYFNELWWSALPWRALELLGAIESGTNVVIIGQTVGPFRYSSRAIGRILQRVPHIYVRDNGSIEVLNRLRITHARRCADSALLCKEHTALTFSEPRGKRRIVVFVQPLTGYVGLEGRRRIRYPETLLTQHLARAISEVAETTMHGILLTTSTLWDASWIVCQRMALELKHASRKVDIEMIRPTSPEDLLSVLSQAAICVSMNMHPLILASMLGIPCVGISYSWKLDSFMHEIGQADCIVGIHQSPLGTEEALRSAMYKALRSASRGSGDSRALRRLTELAFAPFSDLRHMFASGLARPKY